MASRTSPSLLGGALLLAGVVLTTACKRQHEEVPCAAVATHVLAIAQAEAQASPASTAADATLRQRIALQLPALRDSLDGNCTTGNWSLELRRCMVQAADSAALEACHRLLSDAQRAALDRAAETAHSDGR